MVQRHRHPRPRTVRTSAERSGPIRTCVGCRRRFAQAAVVRCALSSGVPVVGRSVPGRGAWVCSRICAEVAVANGGFERAWRRGVDRAGLDAMVTGLGAPLTGGTGTDIGVSPAEVCETGSTRKG